MIDWHELASESTEILENCPTMEEQFNTVTRVPAETAERFRVNVPERLQMPPTTSGCCPYLRNTDEAPATLNCPPTVDLDERAKLELPSKVRSPTMTRVVEDATRLVPSR